MNAITEEETQTPPVEIEEQEEEQPQPEPPTPIRPLAQARADLEKQLSGFKAFVAELESCEGRLARAEAEEGEILDGGAGALSEEEQLEKLSRTLALKKVLERKLERANSSGLSQASGKLENAVREALRSLWHDLAALRAKREERHLATLKKMVGDEDQWGWAVERAKTLMRHFGDLRAIDHLGEAADFSLSHGAVPLAAEQVLSDIARLEGEKAAKR